MIYTTTRRRRTNRLLGLLLVSAGLLAGAGFSPERAGLAVAQTAVPSWSYTGSLNTPRYAHTATLLPNGKVLVVGGFGSSLTNNAELYHPVTGTWSITGSLNESRAYHTATLLPNGQVLVVGGGSVPNFSNFTNTAELYDPTTGTWRLTGNPNEPRAYHTATLLRNGKVLVAGGLNSAEYVTNSAELYDPATGAWSVTGRLNTTLIDHTATLLQNGKVLVAGGQNGSGFADFLVFSTELYDPTTGTWSVTGTLNAARFGHTATLLPNGNVLLAGGACSSGIFCGSGSSRNSSAELYNPATGIWSVTGAMNTPHSGHTATLLPNGQVLIAGGESAEIYDAATGTWNTTANFNTPRQFHSATLLQNGKVLVVGGGDRTNSPLLSAELYDSGSSSTINPIDDPQFFVRQHYLDFLAREPEPSGLAAWLRVLADCPAGDLECLHQARLTTSAAFFGSPEFQLKGYYVFRFYKLAFNRLPTFDEISADMRSVTGQTPAEVYATKAAFTNAFVQRPEFINDLGALSNAAYVTALLNRYQLTSVTTPDPAQPDGEQKVTLTQADLVARLDSNGLTRAQVLRAIADSDEVFQLEFNRAFVAMQYYGYLRRTPEAGGYNAWLTYLTAHPQDFREMVRGFVDSVEYRARFGRP